MAKPLGYFWCLTEQEKLWDNIKNYLDDNGTTMNNIPFCSRLSYDTPKKKTKHSGLKEGLDDFKKMDRLKYKTKVLDTKNDESIKLRDSLVIMHKEYATARVTLAKHVAQHGNSHDDLGIVYKDLADALKLILETTEKKLKHVEEEIKRMTEDLKGMNDIGKIVDTIDTTVTSPNT